LNRQGRQGDVLVSSITEKSKSSKKNLRNEKDFQGQQLAHRFFENLSQKRRSLAIAVRKIHGKRFCGAGFMV